MEGQTPLIRNSKKNNNSGESEEWSKGSSATSTLGSTDIETVHSPPKEETVVDKSKSPDNDAKEAEADDSINGSSEHGSVSSMRFDGTSAHGEESSSSNERSDLSPALAAKETRQVNRSKILVYLVLLVSAVTVGYFTYYFLSQEEENNFETQVSSQPRRECVDVCWCSQMVPSNVSGCCYPFVVLFCFSIPSQVTDFSFEILQSSEKNAQDFLGKLETMSNTITAFAAATEAVWPNVTVQNFDILTTESFEKFIGPELYLFAPIVSRENKKGWEEYADENQGWIKEDLFYRGLQNIQPGHIPDEIYSYYGDDESINEFHVPIWQGKNIKQEKM
jgi:hypothetical protein